MRKIRHENEGRPIEEEHVSEEDENEGMARGEGGDIRKQQPKARSISYEPSIFFNKKIHLIFLKIKCVSV